MGQKKVKNFVFFCKCFLEKLFKKNKTFHCLIFEKPLSSKSMNKRVINHTLIHSRLEKSTN